MVQITCVSVEDYSAENSPRLAAHTLSSVEPLRGQHVLALAADRAMGNGLPTQATVLTSPANLAFIAVP